jgi:hypothetical protein
MNVISGTIVSRSPAFIRPAGQTVMPSTPGIPGARTLSPVIANAGTGPNIRSFLQPGPVLSDLVRLGGLQPQLPPPPPYNPNLLVPPPSTGPFPTTFPTVTWTETLVGGAALVAGIAAIILFARRRRAA